MDKVLARVLRQKPSRMSREDFMEIYGGIYEHSPHFAAAVWPKAGSGELDTLDGFIAALRETVEASGPEGQFKLIHAHPDLAGRLKLSPDSAAEQASAGLDHCSTAEMAAFLMLNASYKQKFGFPFIKAVRGFTREQILNEFRQRIGNDQAQEFATALAEVHKIAYMRLSDLAED
jgi:2-oxo-4-hydroxy-4-carboxy-5-ureidoimidazoline decarboxylase